MVQLESQRTFFSSSPRMRSSASSFDLRAAFAMTSVILCLRTLWTEAGALVSRVDAVTQKIVRWRILRADRRGIRSNGGRPVLTDLVLLGLIGFAAQLVDGALGMAFGIISTSAMLSMGMPPAQASAIVH